MYLSQQHIYSENYNNHSANITLNNGPFFIENQKLVTFISSVHQHPIVASSQSSSILFESTFLPTTGHTTHMIDNDLVSFFGKPDQPSVTMIQIGYSPPSILLPSTSLQQPQSPSKRYAHTTTMVQSKNNTTVFLIGGSTIEHDIPHFDIWKLEWDTKKWINLDVRMESSVPGLMGHVTLVLPSRRQSTHLLLTCFGANHRQNIFYNGCALFNTDTLAWQPLRYSSSTHPAPRIHASMIPMNDTHAVLYGGQSGSSTLLDDLWWLHLDDIDATVTFIPLGHSSPRAGHTASMISDHLMLVHGGRHSPKLGDNTDTMVVDLENQTFWNGNQHHQKRQLAAVDSVAQGTTSQGDGTASNGLSGGAIGGIIVGVILVLGISIVLFVFYQRHRRRQRNYNLHAKGTRFSLATPPRPNSGCDTEQQRTIQPPDPARTRISHMSFGSEFGVGLGEGGPDGSRSSLPMHQSKRTSSTWGTISTASVVSNHQNHPNLLDSPSRQLYTNWICETPIPSESSNNTRPIDPRHTSTYINESTLQHTTSLDNDNEPGNVGTTKKGTSGTTFDRLRLSIFKPLDIVPPLIESKNHTSTTPLQDHTASSSPNQSIATNTTPDSQATTEPMEDQPTASTAKRRSSMFGLSKLLNIGDSSSSVTPRTDQYQDIAKQQQQQQQKGRQGHGKSLDPRESIGSKSVASLQWVEFNSEMDFNGNWTTPRHLAVMNHRQSSATISSGSGFSSMDDLHARVPNSPRDIVAMAQQLQQQHRHIQQTSSSSSSSSTYRLSQRELQNWEDARLSRLIPPSPHRLTSTPLSKSNNAPS